MDGIYSFLGGAMKLMVEAEGECEKHGATRIHINPKVTPAWFCHQCHHDKVVADEEAARRAARREHMHRVAQLPTRYKGKTFDAVTAEHRQVRKAAKAFRDAISVSEACWAVLVLFGGVGTGKTLLATEFGESVIDKLGRSVRYCTAKQMISEIQSSYGAEGKSEEGEVQRFVDYGLLILDEIDAKPDRENANLLLNEVINRRYNAEKPVIVITNQPFDSLGQFVGDRVNDRLHENAFIAAFTWASFRGAQPVQ